jgi:protein gp37
LSFEPHWREKNFNRSMPKEPSRIFVNSMSDVEWWEPEWWHRVMRRIGENPEHDFLFLTKNPAAYRVTDPHPYWPSNCWLGVTVTTERECYELQAELPASAEIKFLSIEPILGQIAPEMIDPTVIDWVILGAESGHRKNRVIPPPEWIEPFLSLEIPLYMKHNLPWDGQWRREFPEQPSE